MNTRTQLGVTLVEVMVSMAIGLLLVAGMIGLYISQSQGSRQSLAFSRMQENARYAFELIGRDLRMVGDTGCYRNSIVNTYVNELTASGTEIPWYGAVDTQPLIGYEDAATTAPTTNGLRSNVLRGDALAVLRADDETPNIISTYTQSTGVFNLTAAPGNLANNDIIVATDCQTAVVGLVTAVSSATVTTKAKTASPYNATSTYAANSRLYALSGHLYYIRNNGAGIPSLYRQDFDNGSTAGVELVEGVEDMQIMYGVDTTGIADTDGNGSVDTYVTADQVTATAPGSSDANKWSNRVLSVRVDLLIRSVENNVATNAQSFPAAYWPFSTPTVVVSGGSAVAQDRRLRKQFTATFTLRGRVH
ncbi:MAG: PilW family protein [Gallionellaceae bacterium]|nr:PilW family protein [Gallionellaceae bacterium]